MTKKRKTPPSISGSSEDDVQVVHIVEYEITDEPIWDQKYRRLPQEAKDAIERLHDTTYSEPEKAIPELIEVIKQYPNVPQFFNYLSAAYVMIGQYEASEQTVEESMRRHPDYLFARINYAQILLRRGETERVAEIFDHKFDLKLLYPKRKRFHVSEVAGFMGVIGWYFVEIGDKDTAAKYYDILMQVAPDYPMTKQLKRKLHPGLLQRLFSRWQ